MSLSLCCALQLLPGCNYLNATTRCWPDVLFHVKHKSNHSIRFFSQQPLLYHAAARGGSALPRFTRPGFWHDTLSRAPSGLILFCYEHPRSRNEFFFSLLLGSRGHAKAMVPQAMESNLAARFRAGLLCAGRLAARTVESRERSRPKHMHIEFAAVTALGHSGSLACRFLATNCHGFSAPLCCWLLAHASSLCRIKTTK